MKVAATQVVVEGTAKVRVLSVVVKFVPRSALGGLSRLGVAWEKWYYSIGLVQQRYLHPIIFF